jgi:hypothetical protein
MPRTGDAIHIPLTTDEAIRLARRVTPTEETPKLGARANEEIQEDEEAQGMSNILHAATGTESYLQREHTES